MLRLLPSLLSLALLSTSACRERSHSSTPAPTEAAPGTTHSAAAPASAAAGGPTAPPPAQPAATALPQAQPGSSETGIVNAPLTGAVGRFMDKHKRPPANWQELVQGGFIKTIPSPPPGKKFAIDPISYFVVEVN